MKKIIAGTPVVHRYNSLKMSDWEKQLFEMARLGPPFRMLQLGSKPWHAFCQPLVEQGCEVIAIDLDGQQKARRFDLCRPVTPEMLGGPCDMITNYGTTEHVEDQAQCWASIHALLKVDGRLVSTVPAPGAYPRHGIWYPPPDWYAEFAQLNGYEVIHLEARDLIGFVARKDQDLPFTMPSTPIHLEAPGHTKLHAGDYELAENHQ